MNQSTDLAISHNNFKENLTKIYAENAVRAAFSRFLAFSKMKLENLLKTARIQKIQNLTVIRIWIRNKN